MASETKQHVPSPGEAFSLGIHGMRMPHLEFMYRIVCQMAVKYTTIPAVPKTNISRLVLPIAGGTVSGPRITGIIVPNSGADWAQVVGDELKQFTRLDARYTLETNDGHYILVNAKGVFQQGPNSDPRVNTNPTVTQDDAEYFTHLSFEASSTGPYGWMNSLVAIGVMTMFEDQPIIDCYRLTNLPCLEPGQL